MPIPDYMDSNFDFEDLDSEEETLPTPAKAVHAEIRRLVVMYNDVAKRSNIKSRKILSQQEEIEDLRQQVANLEAGQEVGSRKFSLMQERTPVCSGQSPSKRSLSEERDNSREHIAKRMASQDCTMRSPVDSDPVSEDDIEPEAEDTNEPESEDLDHQMNDGIGEVGYDDVDGPNSGDVEDVEQEGGRLDGEGNAEPENEDDGEGIDEVESEDDDDGPNEVEGDDIDLIDNSEYLGPLTLFASDIEPPDESDAHSRLGTAFSEVGSDAEDGGANVVKREPSVEEDDEE